MRIGSGINALNGKPEKGVIPLVYHVVVDGTYVWILIVSFSRPHVYSWWGMRGASFDVDFFGEGIGNWTT
jgi:hypothetical protein